MTWNRTTTIVSRRQELESGRDHCACGTWKAKTDYVCDACWWRSLDKQAHCSKARHPHLRLVSSPDPEWTIGGLWYMRDLTATLELGNMTPGTVFEGSQHGRRYVVVQSEQGQRLEAG
jgi:hypothetical protein